MNGINLDRSFGKLNPMVRRCIRSLVDEGHMVNDDIPIANNSAIIENDLRSRILDICTRVRSVTKKRKFSTRWDQDEGIFLLASEPAIAESSTRPIRHSTPIIDVTQNSHKSVNIPKRLFPILLNNDDNFPQAIDLSTKNKENALYIPEKVIPYKRSSLRLNPDTHYQTRTNTTLPSFSNLKSGHIGKKWTWESFDESKHSSNQPNHFVTNTDFNNQHSPETSTFNDLSAVTSSVSIVNGQGKVWKYVNNHTPNAGPSSTTNSGKSRKYQKYTSTPIGTEIPTNVEYWKYVKDNNVSSTSNYFSFGNGSVRLYNAPIKTYTTNATETVVHETENAKLGSGSYSVLSNPSYNVHRNNLVPMSEVSINVHPPKDTYTTNSEAIETFNRNKHIILEGTNNKRRKYQNIYPSYTFRYAVEDQQSGDVKEHEEHRDGEAVKGKYSLVEPDGSIRTVTYTVSNNAGFQATVSNSKNIKKNI